MKNITETQISPAVRTTREKDTMDACFFSRQAAAGFIRPTPTARSEKSLSPIPNMLALIDPAALPALRIAATFFLLINLTGGTYLFFNRHRLFDRDQNVDNDIPAVRKLRIEVVMIPWLVLTTLLVILLINLWRA